MDTSLLERLVSFARADEALRAVILEGSLAAHFQVDELSDYDVNIFALDYKRYLRDDRWLNQIGDVLLYQKEHFQFYNAIIPTRLVLFRDRPRVDFSFWDLTLLAEMVQGVKQYESYQNGYQVLVDKDGLAARLSPPNATGFVISRPGRDEFLQSLYDFWFEAYCVAKYLSRRNLWYAKLIENRYIKDHLYRMALWDHQAARRWQPDPLLHTEGKRFEKWASPELIAAVSRCFSRYDVEDTWCSLFAMLEVFNRLARQMSVQLNIQYPDRVEQDMSDYLTQLRDR